MEARSRGASGWGNSKLIRRRPSLNSNLTQSSTNPDEGRRFTHLVSSAMCSDAICGMRGVVGQRRRRVRRTRPPADQVEGTGASLPHLPSLPVPDADERTWRTRSLFGRPLNQTVMPGQRCEHRSGGGVVVSTPPFPQSPPIPALPSSASPASPHHLATLASGRQGIRSIERGLTMCTQLSRDIRRAERWRGGEERGELARARPSPHSPRTDCAACPPSDLTRSSRRPSVLYDSERLVKHVANRKRLSTSDKRCVKREDTTRLGPTPAQARARRSPMATRERRTDKETEIKRRDEAKQHESARL